MSSVSMVVTCVNDEEEVSAGPTVCHVIIIVKTQLNGLSVSFESRSVEMELKGCTVIHRSMGQVR